jgi:hypothetical protein
MTDIALTGVAYAEINRGIWIARCPQPYCDNAVALVLGAPMMLCHGDRDACLRESPVVWPRDPLAIAALLAMRPAPKTRNWLPHETVEDLIVENAAHDLLPKDWTESGRLSIARTADGMVIGGVMAEVLPAGREVHQLEGLS